MTEEDLLKGNKIDPFEFKLYTLFSSSLGFEVLSEMKERAFMEAPAPDEFSGVMFAWCDARKSVIREILITVDKVRSIIKESNYVGAE